ncbi:MAG: hypothetical protein E5Y59_10395 [Mesorhizobium sp.]|nr:MAG: hypothetical protein E5Y59_10395 [Mesorhizobium sp.]
MRTRSPIRSLASPESVTLPCSSLRLAEEARRIAAEQKARLDAERRAAAEQAQKIERARQPPANDNPPPSGPAPKPTLEPSSIDNLLKSLGGG